MNRLALLVLCFALQALSAHGQSDVEDTLALTDTEERDRIRDTRIRAQAQFANLEVQCYARFAVNDCLTDVRSRKREALGDLRRQEISLNDAQRKRRASDQLLRSDDRAARIP